MPPVAASLAEYATPATAPGRDVVVTDSGGAVTVTVSGALADAGVLSESVTSTVKLSGPVTVGLPVIAPVAGCRVSPAGSDPALIDQVYGLVPPVAASWAL